MDFDKYKMKSPYPTTPTYPLLPLDSTPDLLQKHAEALESFYKELEVWKASRKDWQDEESRLFKEFSLDAMKELGLTEHPKASRAFGMAWSHGHSGGLGLVYDRLADYAELLKD
jgi:hypothetical protein